MKRAQLTAIIEREGDGYVALCPELDITVAGPYSFTLRFEGLLFQTLEFNF